MADELRKQHSDIEVELIKGSGGAFEVCRDGKLIFSKLSTGRFPEPEEILDILAA
ncbi:MAG: SelT/SelW/SelH family protein [Gemmatimonadetes bacterium]|nr:SelT/SelW/SelH family protein [Gemmatimonadota bacterium]NIO33106.1 SelT/SelW/SelH family protein [Gemmatimonadota bacterium]